MDDRLVYDAGVTGAKEQFTEILDKEPVEYTSVLQEAAYIEDADGSKSSVNIIAPEEADRLNRFIGLRDWESGKDYFLPEEGALISRNYTKNRDVDVGDTIRIMDMKGIYHNCRIVGITDYYLPSTQLVMSRGYYEKIMSQPVLWEQPSAVYFH
ncbi:MAG: hypothetical protein J5988_13860 [Eubacterium sp.]|nr:hypothetical protein [Eubacterium sp.]